MTVRCVAAAIAAFALAAADAAPSRRGGKDKRRDDGAGSVMSGRDVGKARLNDGRAENADARVTTATFGPKRTKPVFTGEFFVNLVVVQFPDCEKPSAESVKHDLERVGDHTIADYYKEYSQGTAWPGLQLYPDVYEAPEPLGYYCRHDPHTNPIGFQNGAEGDARAAKLRADALAHAKAASSRMTRPGPVNCWVYCSKLDKEGVESHLRKHYPMSDGDPYDPIEKYKPSIPWSDPLWPNSIVQVLYPSNGRTLIHEIGHVLGAPDFYHSSEEHDGVVGEPSLPWAAGPTGPSYCRYIYQAFVPKETYPTYAKPGVYTLDPRMSRIDRSNPDAPMPVLGCFIPSCHPNYMFCVEYAHDETPPVGLPGAEGLLVSVINVTMSSPLMGPPDLCYTYRRGDPYMKAEGDGGVAYLRTGDSFSMKTDPAARIPPLIPSGIAITDIKEENGKCSFRLSFAGSKPDARALRSALLPKVRLVEVKDVMPTSFRPVCDVIYRGEPLLDEWGFVWDVAKNPTVAKNRFPLFHRDRCNAPIIGLKPGTKYYVRAYAKNANGLTYSKREIEVTTPREAPSEVPQLLADRIPGSFFITRWFFDNDSEGYYKSANSIIALMSLGIYYGVVPGTAPGYRPPYDIRRVHTFPSDSRPKFRMKEFSEYFSQMDKLSRDAGLREHKFGRMRDWQRRCAKALRVGNPDKAFVHTPDVASLVAQSERVRESLARSRPVLLIRQNTYMPNVTETIYPLDIALIDGVGAGGEWHVVFPLGRDRGDNGAETGHVSAETLMTSVEDACLLFYNPMSR